MHNNDNIKLGLRRFGFVRYSNTKLDPDGNRIKLDY